MRRHLLAAAIICASGALPLAASVGQVPADAPEKYGGNGALYKLPKGSCPPVSISVSIAGNALSGELVLHHKPAFHAKAQGKLLADHKVEIDFAAPLGELHASGSLQPDVLALEIKGTIPYLSIAQHQNALCHWSISAKKGEEPANVAD